MNIAPQQPAHFNYLCSRNTGNTGNIGSSSSANASDLQKKFSATVLTGLSEAGGLYVPEVYPNIAHLFQQPSTLAHLAGLSYAQLATYVIGLFIDETDISHADLAQLCEKTYTPEHFKYVRTDAQASNTAKDITPVRHLGQYQNTELLLLEVSNGPTLAFKDMAMQFLGNLFEFILNQHDKKMTILGATSGDTGSAAEYAMRDKANISLFMLSPADKMSAFQQAQMYSLMNANIHNITVEGFFHDCQNLVKSISKDATFKAAYNLTTVNSINWARIVAQVVYYVKAYVATTAQLNLPAGSIVDVCVPSGNFGNLYAAYVAKKIGVPLGKLICATNENNVLDEFFTTGIYRPRTQAHIDIHETSSPSMDIAASSNLERLVFDALRYTQSPQTLLAPFTSVGEQVAAYFNHGLPFDLKGDYPAAWAYIQQMQFTSGCSTHVQRLMQIQFAYNTFGILIDPHTADGFTVARQHLDAQKSAGSSAAMVILETAQALKFSSTITDALEQPFESLHSRHPDFIGLEALPKKVQPLSDEASIKTYIQLNTHVHVSAALK